jgi:hypothetical protein
MWLVLAASFAEVVLAAHARIACGLRLKSLANSATVKTPVAPLAALVALVATTDSGEVQPPCWQWILSAPRWQSAPLRIIVMGCGETYRLP